MCFSFVYKKHKCIHLFIHLAIVIETYNVAGTGLGLKSQWLWGLVIRVYERNLFEEKWKEYVKVFWDTFTNDIFLFKDSFQRYIMFWMGAVWWRSVTGGNVRNVHVNYLKAIYLRQMSHITGEKKKVSCMAIHIFTMKADHKQQWIRVNFNYESQQSNPISLTETNSTVNV